MKKPLAALLLLALGLPACGVFYTVETAGPGVAKPSASATPLEFSAWLVFWDPLSYKSYEANVGRLKRVYPEAYTCQADGLPGRQDTTKAEDMARTVALAHAHGVKVLSMTGNYANDVGGFDPKRVEKFLHDPALMEQHCDGLLALAKADGADGLDVDYESLEAGDRNAFTAFVTRLCAKAHAQGLLVGVALHPKENEPGTWGGPQAQDYAALGAAADLVHLMTYDYHWATGSPGSLAPLPWVRSVGAFAASKIDPRKVELGINGYGYVWRAKGENLTWPAFQDLQSKLGKAERDPDTAELKLVFNGGEAWMADAQTSRKKFDIARDLGVRGVAMWVLGQEDPKTWTAWGAFSAGR